MFTSKNFIIVFRYFSSFLCIFICAFYLHEIHTNTKSTKRKPFVAMASINLMTKNRIKIDKKEENWKVVKIYSHKSRENLFGVYAAHFEMICRHLCTLHLLLSAILPCLFSLECMQWEFFNCESILIFFTVMDF